MKQTERKLRLFEIDILSRDSNPKIANKRGRHMNLIQM